MRERSAAGAFRTVSPALKHSPLFAVAVEDYWTAAKKPLAALLFVLPMLLAYEIGAFALGPDDAPVRTGTDAWVRLWLMDFGWRVPVLLPLLTIGPLLVWHRGRGDRWECRGETLAAMGAESCFLAVLLAACGHLMRTLIPAATGVPAGLLERTVSFLGAGLYEETLFRLLALPVLYWILRSLRTPTNAAWVVSIAVVSVTFAACHYVEGGTETPRTLIGAAGHVAGHSQLWFGFTFRALAGAFFSIVFLVRGFGIAVGTHVLYDLLAGVLLSAAAAG